MGSEQGMGWNFVSRLAEKAEVFVITEAEYERENRERETERLHFYFVPAGETPQESEKVREMCWNQGNWLFYLKYAKWQEKALAVAKEIISEQEATGHGIDVMHQLNMAGFREPGMLYMINEEREREGKGRIPLVWGPMTGYGGIPFKFMTPGGVKFTAFYLVKNMLNTLQLIFHPRVRKMMKASDWVLATSPEMKQGIERYYGRQVERMNETGCSISHALSHAEGKESEDTTHLPHCDGGAGSPLELLWVGRFMYTKQLPLALQTLRALKERGYGERVRLNVVGQGFAEQETEAMHRLAKDVGVDEMCRWHGFIPNDEVQRMMREADVFFFTSIFEGTSTVMLEAIQNCLPVLCFDRCGFGPVVDETVGVKIPCVSPKQAVGEFADAIVSFVNDRTLLERMGENCPAKAQEMSWERKIERVMAVYDSLGNR